MVCRDLVQHRQTPTDPSQGFPYTFADQTSSSISTVLLGPTVFSEQSSINTSIISLQNMPQSVTIFTEAEFLLDMLGMFVVHDIVRDE